MAPAQHRSALVDIVELKDRISARPYQVWSYQSDEEAGFRPSRAFLYRVRAANDIHPPFSLVFSTYYESSENNERKQCSSTNDSSDDCPYRRRRLLRFVRESCTSDEATEGRVVVPKADEEDAVDVSDKTLDKSP
jgi:hypothetical protein